MQLTTNHKYKLTQKVKIVNKDIKGYGKVGIIVAQMLQDNDLYSCDYTVCVPGITDTQYQNRLNPTKLYKIHVQEADIVPVKSVTLYAYRDEMREVHFSSDLFSGDSLYKKGWERYTDGDFVKELP